jgi:hypothetical protein
MHSIREKIAGSIPHCQVSQKSSLYSYALSRTLALEFVLVNTLGEPVLVASRQPEQSRTLFRDYPRLDWILDLTTKPPVLITRSGKKPLASLVPDYRVTAPRSHLVEALVALGLALLLGLILVLTL